MFRFLSLLLLLLPLHCFAEEEITVTLQTDHSLPSLYLNFETKGSSRFTNSYIQEVKKILLFDLQWAGHAELLNGSTSKEALALKEQSSSVAPLEWQKEGVDAIAHVTLNNEGLSASAHLATVTERNVIKPLTLTGVIQEDRAQIHALSDALSWLLFGQRGVASTRILYTIRTKKSDNARDWITEVWESDYDGGHPHQITDEKNICLTPMYVPASQGKRSRTCLYVSYKIGQPKLFVTHLKSGENQRLSLMNGNQLTPAISPSAHLIAFISDLTGNPELFIQPFDREKGIVGPPKLLLALPEGAQGCPTFNPQGDKIAFVSNKDARPRIYTTKICADPNKSIKLITKKNRDNTCPAWSPDGKKLAYCAVTQGVRQIWIYDFESAKEWQLTSGEGNKESPSWAPGSQHLIYHLSSGSSSEIYLAHLQNKKSVRLPLGQGEKRFPCWEPLF